MPDKSNTHQLMGSVLEELEIEPVNQYTIARQREGIFLQIKAKNELI
jgi:hypothetical protein